MNVGLSYWLETKEGIGRPVVGEWAVLDMAPCDKDRRRGSVGREGRTLGGDTKAVI